MATVSYYAWFLFDYRPKARPDEGAHKQMNVPASTKVSVCEEIFKGGVKWLRIHPPAGLPTDVAYPEWWVPSHAVATRLTEAPAPLPPYGDIRVVPEDVLAAAALILAWLKS